MSEKKLKVGDRVRFKTICINCDEDVRVAEGDYGTVVSVGSPLIKNSNDIGIELDVPQYISVYSKDVELVESIEPRTAFLRELKELLSKHNVKIYSEFSAYISADVNGEGVYFPNSELTADNIMDYEKE